MIHILTGTIAAKRSHASGMIFQFSFILIKELVVFCFKYYGEGVWIKVFYNNRSTPNVVKVNQTISLEVC